MSVEKSREGQTPLKEYVIAMQQKDNATRSVTCRR